MNKGLRPARRKAGKDPLGQNGIDDLMNKGLRQGSPPGRSGR